MRERRSWSVWLGRCALMGMLIGWPGALTAQAPGAGTAELADTAGAAAVPTDSTEAGALPGALADTTVAPPEALRVYLDCDRGCDFAYIRRQIPFVAYVRDRQSAQIHVLITQQNTGSGGDLYRLSFLGQQDLAGEDRELTYISQTSDTQDERREGLARVLALGLATYVAATPLASQITVGYEGGEESAGRQAGESDPWDHWVFEVRAGGSFDQEESEGSYDYNASLSADRVTEKWKIRSQARIEYEHERIEDDDDVIHSASHDNSASLDFIRSLSPRWSAALFSDLYSRTFTNIDHAVRLTTGVEYNIFPWDISDRKEFTVAYTAGIRSYAYNDTTIYDEISETLPTHSLTFNLRFTQPWGNIRSNLDTSQYLSDMSKYQVRFETNLDLRLTKGLSLFVRGAAQSVHDQLYLPKGDATLEEILLRRRDLATTYEVSMDVGLGYTFGSIYNNVVNQRF